MCSPTQIPEKQKLLFMESWTCSLPAFRVFGNMYFVGKCVNNGKQTYTEGLHPASTPPGGRIFLTRACAGYDKMTAKENATP